jgi:type IV secretion system protein VirB9
VRGGLLALLLLAGAQAASAQVRPTPGPGDPRLQTIEYRDGEVVLLELAPGYQMTLELAQDEQIENVAVGNSAAFQITPNRRGDRLFIKALQAGAATNLTVITSSRLYAIELSAIGGSSSAYVVRYLYAEDEKKDEGAATPPTEVAGRYRLRGDKQLRPSAIADDGIRTYIEWPKEAPIPAVFSVDEKGRESLVNGAMRGDLFVIDSIATKLVFRIDDGRAEAVRRMPRKKS